MSILYEILKLVIHGFSINLLSIDNNNNNDSNNKNSDDSCTGARISNSSS